MKNLRHVGAIALLCCVSGQATAAVKETDVTATPSLVTDFAHWRMIRGGAGDDTCPAKMIVTVTGARQPWQLCVKTGLSKECRWLEATDGTASFNSYSGLGSLGSPGSSCPGTLGGLGGPQTEGLGALGGSEGVEDGLGRLGGQGSSDAGFLVFVQNHPDGQACIVNNAEGTVADEGIYVTCYDIVR